MSFLNDTVEDLIKSKFGDKPGENIIKAIKQCDGVGKEGIELVDCVLKQLKYSPMVEQEIFDFLYHFVIVG